MEETEPQPLAGISVQVVAAENVWMLEGGDQEKSKASITIKFPGKQADDSTFDSEDFVPFIPPPPELTPEEQAAKEAADAAKAKDAKGKKGAEDPGPQIPGNYPMGFTATFNRKSEWLLWHTMMNQPLALTLQIVPPGGGGTKTPMGTCTIDMAPLLRLKEGNVETSCLLEKIKEEEPAAGAKGKAPPPKKDPKAPAAPTLLEGAMVKIVLSTSIPLLSEVDRKEAIDFVMTGITVKPLPPKAMEFLQNSADDPFLYKLKFYFPGFTGNWWDSVGGLEDEERKLLPFGVVDGGLVKNIQVVSGENLAEGEEPPPPTTETVASWGVPQKRFLPSEGALELKRKIRRKTKFYGELSRNIKDSRVDIFDPCFKNYQCGFYMDLSELVKDGVSEATLTCPLQDCRIDGPLLLSQIERTLDMKKAGPVEQIDPNDAAKNFWKESQAVLIMHVKLSQPLEPRWVPPPEPEVKIVDVLPLRPKLQTVYSATQIAVKEFSDFVKAAGTAIGNVHTKLVQVRKDQKMQSAASRVEHVEEMRKHLSQELHKTGAWQEMRDKMRDKVRKIATEKFKLKKEDAIAAGKFEFCNALYVQLMDEIQSCLREVFAEKNLLDKNVPGAVYSLDYLREVADEYEVERDLRSADKFHLDRVVGEGAARACAWYEYGAFWMRHKPVDHGKAEECFRESINLCRDYMPSLQALGCLLWHRGFHNQAESILRDATELNTPEEFILWAMLARVHAAKSERSSYFSCRRRAEISYNMLIASSEKTPVLRMESGNFPFSPSKFILRTPLSNSPFIQTALVLLDLNLPEEAVEVLEMEDGLFTNTVEYFMSLAMVRELQDIPTLSEDLFKEALSLEYEDSRTWCLLAHMRYYRGELDGALYAYTKVLQYLGEGELMYQYAYLEMGHIYLQKGDLQAARQVFLKGASAFPSSSLWLGAAIAFYKLGDMINAEKALVEGNLLDAQNFRIWAYLTLVCIFCDRMEEAEVALQQSLKNFKDSKLLAEIGAAFSAKQNYRLAEIAFSESLQETDDLDVRFQLGDVLYRLGKSNEL